MKQLNMQSRKAPTGDDVSDGGFMVHAKVFSAMNKIHDSSVIKDQAAAAAIPRRVVAAPTRLTRNAEDVDVLPRLEIK
jgi:hypothetical protein